MWPFRRDLLLRAWSDRRGWTRFPSVILLIALACFLGVCASIVTSRVRCFGLGDAAAGSSTTSDFSAGTFLSYVGPDGAHHSRWRPYAQVSDEFDGRVHFDPFDPEALMSDDLLWRLAPIEAQVLLTCGVALLFCACWLRVSRQGGPLERLAVQCGVFLLGLMLLSILVSSAFTRSASDTHFGNLSHRPQLSLGAIFGLAAIVVIQHLAAASRLRGVLSSEDVGRHATRVSWTARVYFMALVVGCSVEFVDSIYGHDFPFVSIGTVVMGLSSLLALGHLCAVAAMALLEQAKGWLAS